MMTPGNEIIVEACKSNSVKIMKVRRAVKPKMMQQLMLAVVVVVCLSSQAQRAFVSADEDATETTTTPFGEC
jgi:hypothetical protein